MWPNKEAVTDELLAKLEEPANNIAIRQPEQSRRLKEAIGFLATGAREVLVDVVSEAAGIK
jgi:hypothetical protein